MSSKTGILGRLAGAALLVLACDVADDDATNDACVADDAGNCLSVGGSGGGDAGGGEGGAGGGGGAPGGGSTADAPLIQIFWEGMGAMAANDDDELTVSIDDGEDETHTYRFGMAETGSGENGWYGEDCLPGEVNGKDVCHEVGEEGEVLYSVSDFDQVNDENTLNFKASHDAGKITYVVIQVDTDKCWAFGDDPTYYTESVLHCATYDSPQ